MVGNAKIRNSRKVLSLLWRVWDFPTFAQFSSTAVERFRPNWMPAIVERLLSVDVIIRISEVIINEVDIYESNLIVHQVYYKIVSKNVNIHQMLVCKQLTFSLKSFSDSILGKSWYGKDSPFTLNTIVIWIWKYLSFVDSTWSKFYPGLLIQCFILPIALITSELFRTFILSFNVIFVDFYIYRLVYFLYPFSIVS